MPTKLAVNCMLIAFIASKILLHNKAFKADLQRVAFLFWLSFVFTVAWFKLGGSVAHYLTRR